MSGAATPICPVCRGTSTRLLAGPQQRWRYRGCDACGHRWLDPMPTAAELGRYYNSAYSVPLDRYARRVAQEFPVVRRFVDDAAPDGAERTMLEIGCSYGVMLGRFAAAGWRVEGVELDGRAAAHARDALGLRVHHGRLEDALAAGALAPSHSVVTMYHVLEHIEDPRHFLELVATTCTPGGALVLKTPNAASLPARALGGWWEWAAVPEHVHLFTPASLELLLRQTGWAPIARRTRRGDAQGMLFELARGVARRIARQRPRGETVMELDGEPDAPVSTRGWYQRARRILDVAGAPLDRALDALGARRSVGPELLVAARRTDGGVGA